MGIGTSTRNAVTSAINVIGSTLIITGYTIASSDSGHSGQVETPVSTATEIAIPFSEFKEINKQKFGDLEVGGFQLALKHTATFEISGDTKYRVTYNSEVYDITNIQRFAIEDVLVAWIITLSKRLIDVKNKP